MARQTRQRVCKLLEQKCICKGGICFTQFDGQEDAVFAEQSWLHDLDGKRKETWQ